MSIDKKAESEVIKSMNIFESLKVSNPHIKLYDVRSNQFRDYGNVLSGIDFSNLSTYMETTSIPISGNVYVASVAELENSQEKKLLQSNVYGGTELQIGYCNGVNSRLNGLEYHKCSEINIAITDMILLLGKLKDIHQNTYDVQNVEGFFVPRGTVIEMFQTTLHFGPCKVLPSGFKCVVVLPQGTNTPIERPLVRVTEEDDLLFMKNKWLLVHPSLPNFLERGAFPGIVGDNVEVALPNL